MSKEREIAEVLGAVVSAFAEFRIRAPVELSDEERAAYQAAYDLCCSLQSEPKPAPQSELEAVRLLRLLEESLDDTESDNRHLRKAVRDFLSRSPGPDWRTLAKKAWEGWQSAQMTKPMYAIRDAIASEVAAAGEVKP